MSRLVLIIIILFFSTCAYKDWKDECAIQSVHLQAVPKGLHLSIPINIEDVGRLDVAIIDKDEDLKPISGFLLNLEKSTGESKFFIGDVYLLAKIFCSNGKNINLIYDRGTINIENEYYEVNEEFIDYLYKLYKTQVKWNEINPQ